MGGMPVMVGNGVVGSGVWVWVGVEELLPNSLRNFSKTSPPCLFVSSVSLSFSKTTTAQTWHLGRPGICDRRRESIPSEEKEEGEARLFVLAWQWAWEAVDNGDLWVQAGRPWSVPCHAILLSSPFFSLYSSSLSLSDRHGGGTKREGWCLVSPGWRWALRGGGGIPVSKPSLGKLQQTATKRKRELLKSISSHMKKHPFPPSSQEAGQQQLMNLMIRR